MKTTVDAKRFYEAMDKASKVLKKSALPILEQVFFRFDGEKCEMTTTDFRTWITAEIPAAGDAFCFSFYQSKDALKTCRYFDGPTTIEAVAQDDTSGKDCRIHLSDGTRKAEFDGSMNEEDFFRAPDIDGEPLFTVNAAKLLKRIERVQYAACKTDKPSDIAYTCIQFMGNSIFTLDGRRAACDVDASLTLDRAVLLQADTLLHLKLFANSNVEVSLGKHFVRFSCEGLSLYCHLINAVPTQLDRVLPKSFVEEITVCPKEFLHELDYLKGLLTPKDSPSVHFCDGELSLVKTRRSGSTTVRIEGKSTISFGFNLRYMADALKQFAREAQVRMKISGRSSPIILEAEGRSDYAVVMPIYLRESRAA